MSLIREVKNLCERLAGHARLSEEEPNLTELARKNCYDEIEIAEMLYASKKKLSPLTAQRMFALALKRNMPEKVKILLEGVR